MIISYVLEKYFPCWDPPEDYGADWESCCCPVHGDENPSAVVSYTKNAFRCFACGYSGDYLSIIMKESGCEFQQAIAEAKRIAEEQGVELPQSARRKSGRRVSTPARFGSFTGNS